MPLMVLDALFGSYSVRCTVCIYAFIYDSLYMIKFSYITVSM